LFGLGIHFQIKLAGEPANSDLIGRRITGKTLLKVDINVAAHRFRRRLSCLQDNRRVLAENPRVNSFIYIDNFNKSEAVVARQIE